MPNSFDVLQRTLDAVVRDVPSWRAQGALITSAGPGADSDVVEIGLQNRDSNLEPQLLTRYGSGLVTIIDDAGGEAASSRFADGSPFNGGDQLDVAATGGGHCTAGYGGHSGSAPASTSTHMVIAGHCFANGASVYHNGVKVGTASRSGTTYVNGGTDYELITMNSSRLIWETDAARAQEDGSVTSLPVGVSVCHSGSETNKRCGTTAEVGTCFTANDIGLMFCHQDRVTSSALLIAGGDSGGPWFLASTISGTRYFSAVGISSIAVAPLYTCTTHSGSNTKCSNGATYTEASYIWSQFSVWPNY